jgi:hypothetical protein
MRLPHGSSAWSFWQWVLVFSALACAGVDGTQGAESQQAQGILPPASKKGLQVQMVDDALALGIRHAALNFNLSQLVDLKGDPANPSWGVGDRVFRFHRGYLESLDREIKILSDAGVVVSLILLAYESGNEALDRVVLHPSYNRQCPNHLGAFNTKTSEGRAWFQAAMEFLGARWAPVDGSHGVVQNWIVGNEVNSHWFWANMGEVGMETFANDYVETVRLAHDSLKRHSSRVRVYISMEHHWNIRYPGGHERQAFAGRPFLEYFHRKALEGGDFEWHLAFHPYPENLFEPKTWMDQSATADVLTSPRITFRNLEVLPRYLEQSRFQFQGRVRRILLSEQGFHTPSGPNGEVIQAAAYCYAWVKVQKLPGIEAFILHRHVDHGQEGGLKLGLWSRDESAASPAAPKSPKRLYQVFKAAGTVEWRQAFEFALPIIGLRDWDAILPPPQ